MADDIANAASAVASAVTGADTPANVRIVSATSKRVEWTLFAALGTLALIGAALIGVLAFLKWPDSTAIDRVHYLGWMGWMTQCGVLLIIFAVASPWVGKVEASAGDAHVSIDGR
jgi:hypothetical protein